MDYLVDFPVFSTWICFVCCFPLCFRCSVFYNAIYALTVPTSYSRWPPTSKLNHHTVLRRLLYHRRPLLWLHSRLRWQSCTPLKGLILKVKPFVSPNSPGFFAAGHTGNMWTPFPRPASGLSNGQGYAFSLWRRVFFSDRLFRRSSERQTNEVVSTGRVRASAHSHTVISAVYVQSLFVKTTRCTS